MYSKNQFLSLKTLLVVTAFAVAMAMLESAVVIYLRAMLYPNGFKFPLEMLDMGLASVEISREFATLVMLAAIGWLIGHNANTRLAWFLYSFAIWDIFYYVFLKVFLDWPATLDTWDVLFLIPVMWVGPVWAPILLSITMIGLSYLLIYINHKGNIRLGSNLWILIAGALVCITSFCWDIVAFLVDIPNVKWYDPSAIFNAAYVPVDFPFWMFFIGFALIVVGMMRYAFQNKFSNDKLMRAQLL